MSEAARSMRPPAPERPERREDSGVHKIPEQKKPELRAVPKPDDEVEELSDADLKPFPHESGKFNPTLRPEPLKPRTMEEQGARLSDNQFPFSEGKSSEVSSLEKSLIENEFMRKQRIPRAIEIGEQNQPGLKDKLRIAKGGADYAKELQDAKDAGWPPATPDNAAVEAATRVEQKGPELIEQAEDRVHEVTGLDKARNRPAEMPLNMGPSAELRAGMQRKLDLASNRVNELQNGKGGVSALEATLKSKYGYDAHNTSTLGELGRGVRSLFDRGFRAMLKTHKMRSAELDQARTAEASLQNEIDQAEAEARF